MTPTSKRISVVLIASLCGLHAQSADSVETECEKRQVFMAIRDFIPDLLGPGKTSNPQIVGERLMTLVAYGNTEAILDLGFHYSLSLENQAKSSTPTNLATNLTIGHQLSLKAAIAGNTAAMETVGSHFVGGDGCPKDFGRAEYWLRKSVEGGRLSAAYSLGHFLIYSKKDYVGAEGVLSAAFDKGLGVAAPLLFDLYFEREGHSKRHWKGDHSLEEIRVGIGSGPVSASGGL